MTALSAVLAAGGVDGVYRAPDDTRDELLERLAADAGWNLVRVDTTDITTKRDVLATIKEAFWFGDSFGYNLDALVDSLRDVEHQPGTLMVWDGPDDFAEADADEYRKLVSVLRSRSDAGAGDGQPGRFVTLLRSV